MDEVSAFEAFFYTEVIGLAEVTTLIGTRLYNSKVPPKSAMPYGVFKVTPFRDKTGQAGSSIQTWLLVDLKFISGVPPNADTPAAIEAVKEYFRTARTFDSAGFRKTFLGGFFSFFLLFLLFSFS